MDVEHNRIRICNWNIFMAIQTNKFILMVSGKKSSTGNCNHQDQERKMKLNLTKYTNKLLVELDLW